MENSAVHNTNESGKLPNKKTKNADIENMQFA